LFYGNAGQLAAQALEAGSILAFVFGISNLFFKVLAALKLLRASPKDEIMGLDMPEMGAPGYTTVDIRMPGGRLSHQIPVIGGGKE
jgi:Amt family ammonium transporter